MSLLLIQLVSSQFSPRAVYGFYRDTFNKVVMGVAVGTFTYCLVVLRAVRRPFEEGGQADGGVGLALEHSAQRVELAAPGVAVLTDIGVDPRQLDVAAVESGPVQGVHRQDRGLRGILRSQREPAALEAFQATQFASEPTISG